MKYVAQSAWFSIAILWICLSLTASPAWGQFTDAAADATLLPSVAEGFEVTLVASEPLVRQPCSMAFDRRGRLFIGMGPQYRNPTPETDGDRVVLVLDENHDGKADRIHAFGEGLNAIQGLLWVGDDLWVANAPDLTILRDLDGDDVADRYTRLYTDLGNLEHGLHGLQLGPDGRVYMSKGNSKGLTQPGRVAPKAFRD
ncbi:MAG: PVC-type heme-binding CxxCH protein, partial [Pirellulaceae bacterium]